MSAIAIPYGVGDAKQLRASEIEGSRLLLGIPWRALDNGWVTTG